MASNTSGLSIAEMATATNRRDKVAGLHYFYPPVINQLLEIVVAEETAPEVAEALLVFARTTGKVPIITRDAPGFAVNRFFLPWLNEAARILDEGLADIPTIDQAARETFGIGMGPFALMNATGVPIAYHATSAVGLVLGDFYTPAAALVAQFEAGQPWNLEGETDESADLVELEVGELLTKYQFPGDKIPVIRGSALKAMASASTDLNAEEYKCIFELLGAVDSYIPTPDRPIDKPFLMPIEDVFTISGRGTVVTGRVERGIVKVGEEVEIVGLGETRKTVATGVEMFRKLLDEGRAGDNIGVLASWHREGRGREGSGISKAW